MIIKKRGTKDMRSRIATFFIVIVTILIIAVFGIFGMIIWKEFKNLQIGTEVEGVKTEISENQNKNTIDKDIKIPEIIENPFDEIQDSTQNPSINVDYSNVTVDKYFYNQLEEPSKTIYKAFESNKENMKSGTYRIDLGNSFSDILNQINGSEMLGQYYQSAIEAYTYDNPEIFYLSPNKMYLNIETTTFGNSVTYNVYINNGNENNYLIDEFHLISPIDNEEDKESLAALFNNFQDENAYLYIVHHKLNWAPSKMTFPLYRKVLALKRESSRKFQENLSNVEQPTSRWISVHWLSTILYAKDSSDIEAYDAIDFCRSFGGKIHNANPLTFGFLHSECSTPLGLEDNSSIPKRYIAHYGPQGALMPNNQYFTSINVGAFLNISFGERAFFRIQKIEIESVPKADGDKKMAKRPNQSLKIDRTKRLGYPDSLKISLNSPNSTELKELHRDNIKYIYNEEQGIDKAEYIVGDDESDDFVANNLKVTLSSKNKAGGIILRLGRVEVDGFFT